MIKSNKQSAESWNKCKRKKVTPIMWLWIHHHEIPPFHHHKEILQAWQVRGEFLSINGFNELTIQSTIKDSDGDDAESDPISNPKLDTYTTNLKTPQKLFNNWFIPKIILGAIRPIDQLSTEDVPWIWETLDAWQTMLSKDIFTDATRSGARIFRTPREVSWTDRDGSMPQDVNTTIAAARLNPPIQNFNSTYDSPTRTGTQEIFNTIEPAGPQWISNAEKLKSSINGFIDKNSGPRPSFSKSVDFKVTVYTRVNVN